MEECNVNYLHLMPLLASPKGKSDGGYAVADFRTVQPELGTMEDFSELTSKCHERGINICLDFVMNHTSEEHEWAKRARAGEKEYQDRYFFFDTYDVPALYEKTCPQVFPTTAPGNFTWLDDLHKHVMTTFYPYQWDLNYRNPVVFNEMVYNMLYLANQGVDIVRLDAVPYIWKQLGTNCRNLPQVHTIVRENAEEKFIGIYNFSDQDKVAWINEDDGIYTDLISGHEMEAKGVMIPAFGCFWLCRKK